MKKLYLALALLAAMPIVGSAQTLLDEGFESTSTETYDPNLPDGWTSVDSYTGNVDKYRWHVYYYEKGTITGTHVASVDAPMFSSTAGDAAGPREEILLSPEMTLDNTYQLSFDWDAPSASPIDNQEYDFQVRVVVDGDVENAETVWSFTNAEQLKECGNVPYPWTGWQTYKSTIDLSAWQGKNVKIAFVYKMLKTIANVLYIDNVTVKQFTPATSPKPVLSKKQYSFGEVYIGSKVFSDVLTLKNEGKNGLKITSIDCPTGFETTIDPATVNLDANESLEFQISYSASLTAPTSGYVTIHTNGGDVQVKVLATKLSLPDGYTFEGFENGCPPAGWDGSAWKQTTYALEGDHSAYATVSLDGASVLTSPRLDMSTGTHTLTFTAYNEFDSDEEDATPGNDVTVEFSTDGGATWSTVWTSETFNAIENVSIDLGTPASDNCYVRWTYGEVDLSDEDNIPETSIMFIDAVVLPPLYGADGVPQDVTLLTPADAAENLYNKNVTLTWRPALFADGYKLYVGTDADATNLINGEDLGNVTSYTLPRLEYASTYTWKVVAYNTNGDGNASQRTFTTMADQTVTSFPWSEGFESGENPTLGWNIEYDSYTKWSTDNKVNPFEGKYSASVGCNATEKETSLVSPDFTLPAGKKLEMSFYWGNAMPVSLVKDETGLVSNPTVEDNGEDVCYFEILADNEWKQLAMLSDPTSDDRYWYHETIKLDDYAGKTVTFRWRYVGHSYYQAHGAALDMITIQETASQKASFNATSWNAGTANAGETISSGNKFTVLNEGNNDLTIESATFGTENFTSTLAAGTVVKSKRGIPFVITFAAGNTGAVVNDVLTVQFEGGLSITLPVTARAMATDSHYYNFENDTPGAFAPAGFTTIDVDGLATKAMTGMSYPQRGAAFAFTVQNTNDWNSVLDPVSGEQTLVAIAPSDEGTSADDWIISQKLTATAQSSFSFYARNWESTYSILPQTQSNVEVLVSTASNTNTADFTTVMATTTMPFYHDDTWEHYTVDLSAYAGKDIYVAVRHTVKDGLAAFFDDFYFEHFASDFDGVNKVNSDAKVSVYPNPVASTLFVAGVEDAKISVYNMAGSLVATAEGSQIDVDGLAAGVYVVRVATADSVMSTRIVKK